MQKFHFNGFEVQISLADITLIDIYLKRSGFAWNTGGYFKDGKFIWYKLMEMQYKGDYWHVPNDFLYQLSIDVSEFEKIIKEQVDKLRSAKIEEPEIEQKDLFK